MTTVQANKYLKETGLLEAYQAFINHLMHRYPLKGDVMKEAAVFLVNYEKKLKAQRKKMGREDNPSAPQEDEVQVSRHTREKIILKSKPRSRPSAQTITPAVFETQEAQRPQLLFYKQKEIDYSYIDVVDGNKVYVDLKKTPDELILQSRAQSRESQVSGVKLDSRQSQRSSDSVPQEKPSEDPLERQSQRSSDSVPQEKPSEDPLEKAQSVKEELENSVELPEKPTTAPKKEY